MEGRERSYPGNQRQEEKNRRSLFVSAGKIWNKVTKGTNFEIESIHGVASVKGTEFDVLINGEMNTWVAEGLVEIYNDLGRVLAGKNTHTLLKKDEEPKKEDIKKEDLPKRDDMKAKINIRVKAPGKKLEGNTFPIFISLRDAETNKPIKQSGIPLKVFSSSDTVKLSLDGSVWAQEIEVEAENGKIKLLGLGSVGESLINVVAKDMTGVEVPVVVHGVIKSKSISVKFVDYDGTEKEIILNFKRK